MAMPDSFGAKDSTGSQYGGSVVGVACSQLLAARQHLRVGVLPPLTLSLLCLQHLCCSEDCSHWGAAFFGRLQSLQLARDWRPAGLVTESGSCCSCKGPARLCFLQSVRNLTAFQSRHLGSLLLGELPVAKAWWPWQRLRNGAGSRMPGADIHASLIAEGTSTQVGLIAEGTHAPEGGGSAQRAAAAGSGGRH